MFSLTGLFKLFSSTADEALSAAGAPRFFVVNGGEGDQNSAIHLHLHTTAPVTIAHATSASSVEHPSRAGSAAVNVRHSKPRQRIQPLRRRRSQDARANIMRAAGQQSTGHSAYIQRSHQLLRAPRPSLSHAGQIRTHPRTRSRIVTRAASPALFDVSGVSNAATFGGSSRESSPGLILFPLSGPRTGDSHGSGFRSIPSAWRERSCEATEEKGLRLPESVDSESLSSLSPASGATGPVRILKHGTATTQRRKRTRSFIHQAEGYDGDDSSSEFEVDTTRRVRRRLSSSTRIPFGSSSEPLSSTHSTSLHPLTAPQAGVGKGKKRTRATAETDHSSSEEDSPSPMKRPRLVLRPQRKTRPHPSKRAKRSVQASPAVSSGPHGSDASRSSHRLALSQIPHHSISLDYPSSLFTSSHPSTSSSNSSIFASSATSFSSVSSAKSVKEEDMDEAKESA